MIVSPCLRPCRRGVALVLVLGCLVLLSILVVAFLASVKTEMTSSSGYANSSDVKQRSQTAVNMVIAQIQEASSGTTTSWTSQPGLIRTYLANGQSGQSYKLYSSGTMVAASNFDPNAGTEVPADWKSRPAEYSDLNQPVLVADPAGSIAKDNLKYTPNYPILDPGAIGTVKGFSIDGNELTPPDYSSTDPIANNPAPMPVQWLYILEDGSVRPMNPTTKVITGASAQNPIVSRIAFWTDDDTCKININTAAGDEWDDTSNPGSFTDMPRARTDFEEKTLAMKQPVNHEYQRFPGHPATTYLSAVFPSLTRSQIAEIIPRISFGGSQGGSLSTATTGTSVAALAFSDGTPLYATVDELRYVRSGSSRTSQPIFTPRQIEQSSFFLTAHSRAPELNLFNRPRISLWPEPLDALKRTSYDKTMAFCATVAGDPFQFMRYDQRDPLNDYEQINRNKLLYQYLQKMTAQEVPGFGASFLNKYPVPVGLDTPERDQILTEIFDYVRGSINLVDSSAGAFPYAGPYFTGDLRDAPSGSGHVVPIQIAKTRGFGRSMTVYSPILLLTGLRAEVDANGAIDKPSGTNAAGDGFYRGSGGTYENAQLAKIRTREVQPIFLMDMFSPSLGPVRFTPNLIFNVKGLNNLTLDGVNMGFPANAEMNLNRYAPNHEYAWGGYVNHAAFFYDRSFGVAPKTIGGSSNAYSWVGNVLAIDKEYKKSTLRIDGGNEITIEVFSRDESGNKKPTPLQTITCEFPSVDVPTPTVRGMYVWSYTNSVNPTIPYRNPPVYADAISASLGTSPVDSPGLVNVGYNSSNVLGQTMFHVSRSLVPAHGDMRLLAARQNVSKADFIKGRGYDSPTDNTYGTLWKVNNGEETSGGMVGAAPTSAIGGNHYSTSGKLVSTIVYDQHIGSNPVKANDRGPMVPSTVNGAYLVARDGTLQAGDWDTGMGSVYDGPYIGKADEGERDNGAYTSHSARVSIGSLFSPNRQVPSPIVLGSLSTGVLHNRPWQTLLFCPNPAAKALHPGSVNPPDHLLLDLFWMPVVEPYAISEPFSTAGKINLNYQIVPFTNIKRSTGLQALLRSTRVTAIPNDDGLQYKSAVTTAQYRHLVNIGETLSAFDTRFTNNQPFRSASEICDMFLVPLHDSATLAGIITWWDSYKLTGDNLREHPYSQLYSRLTTKSNTYTVHVRAQSLKKVDRNRPAEWVDGTDKVMGEYRGSFAIERYLDPNLASYDEDKPLTAYKFRTLSTKHFTP